MASKRIDELTTRTVVNTDLLPPTPSGGPSGSATVAAVVRAGLSQPNSASAGAGADITILAADGVTSGAGGSIILEPGAQATTGGNGSVIIRQPNGASGSNETAIYHDGVDLYLNNQFLGGGCVVGVQRADANPAGVRVFRVVRSDATTRYVDLVPDVGGSGQSLRFSTSGWIEANGGSSNLTLRSTYIVITDANNAHDCAISRASVGTIRIRDNSTGGASFAFTSSTTSAITASQNNYVLNGSAFQRINCTTASNITGIAPPTSGSHVDGRMIRIVSVGASTVTLKHNDAASSSANRMYMASGADMALATNAWADLVYDSTDNGSGAAGWRVY